MCMSHCEALTYLVTEKFYFPEAESCLSCVLETVDLVEQEERKVFQDLGEMEFVSGADWFKEENSVTQKFGILK